MKQPTVLEDKGQGAPSWEELNCYEIDHLARTPGEVFVVVTNANVDQFRAILEYWDARHCQGIGENVEEVVQMFGYYAVAGTKTRWSSTTLLKRLHEFTEDEIKQFIEDSQP
jgi:hypothetical protein